MPEFPDYLNKLAQFRKFIEHAEQAWPEFQARREERLVQARRNGGAAEKVAENIIDDFFTIALDWDIADLNNQIGYADIILTRSGIKRLIVEAKRPASLGWDQLSLERALTQARRYADEQRVNTIAVSDGVLFYAADIVNGGLQPRAQLRLDSATFSPNSWWISKDGIDRSVEVLPELAAQEETMQTESTPAEIETDTALLHAKYKIPANCFAYVPDASNPKTWKLPCWKVYGAEVDTGRLPGAIRAVVTNYRGTRATVPEEAVPDVLVRLGKAAAAAYKLPGQDPNPKDSYRQLYDALYQIGRLEEVL